jgi:ABC-2 type transport system permease protein
MPHPVNVSLANIGWLGVKELRSFLKDYTLLALVIWSFSLGIIAQANGTSQELHNAAIAVVDEDRSQLSQEIVAAFLPPYFKPAETIPFGEMNRALDRALYTFVIDVPPHFARDVAAGRSPAIQTNIDATAAMQAGVGAGYIGEILGSILARHAAHGETAAASPVNLVVHVAFNPNVTTGWFVGIMGIVNNVTMLAIVLTGAAVIREREHGTMDHLLMMPLRPYEIALAKIWANALVITAAAGLSLVLVMRLLLGVPIAGSVPLFMCSAVLYLFFATAVGIFIGTLARSMPQLGLLFILIAVPMMMLSGGNTPLDSMPRPLRLIMEAFPSTHLVSSAQAILFRGAGFATVWPDFLVSTGVGLLFLLLALWRFRQVSAVAMQ